MNPHLAGNIPWGVGAERPTAAGERGCQPSEPGASPLIGKGSLKVSVL